MALDPRSPATRPLPGSPLHTPLKSRTNLNHSTTPRREGTESACVTPVPGSPRRKVLPGSAGHKAVGASPQVKAALALLRQKKAAELAASAAKLLRSSQSDSSTSSSSTTSLSTRRSTSSDETSTSSVHRDGVDNVGESEAGAMRRAPDVDEWGLKSLTRTVDDARWSGRLNLASRSLTAVPSAAYETLIPLSSPFHSSTYASLDQELPASPPRGPTGSGYASSPRTPVKSAVRDVFQEERPGWEQVDLKVLNLGSNALRTLEEQVGGFEDLLELDVHNNRLSSLPFSLSSLQHLTIFKLSLNPLEVFPEVLLSLKELRVLDLSECELRGLWRESATGAPFPHLTTLLLSTNSFTPDALLPPFAFPSELKELDLSGCGLVPTGAPMQLFAGLQKLERLALKGNELDGSLWAGATASSPIFPSLLSLDLSHNSITILANLESALAATLDRPFAYQGLEEKVAKALIDAGGTIGGFAEQGLDNKAVLEVRLGGNGIGEEDRKRRRAVVLAGKRPAARPIEESLVVSTSSGINVESQEESLSVALKELTFAEDTASDALELVDYGPDPTPDLFLSALDLLMGTLVLSNLRLDALPLSSSPLLPSSPHRLPVLTLDLSFNLFTLLPLCAIHSWSWESLATLHLAGNQISGVALGSLLGNGEFEGLQGLRELDLSRNQMGDSIPVGDEEWSTFRAIHILAPNLEKLNLSHNLLTRTTDLPQLLAPTVLPSKTASSKGVSLVDLSNNSISDLDGLLQLVDSFRAWNLADKESKVIRGREGLWAERLAEETGWRCAHLDLSDNHISRLPPAMGHLPLLNMFKLNVQGNSFRIPRREMFEAGGGGRVLLEWLRERCAE